MAKLTSNRLVVIGSAFAIGLLLLVLAFTIVRVLNPQNVFPKPQAVEMCGGAFRPSSSCPGYNTNNQECVNNKWTCPAPPSGGDLTCGQGKDCPSDKYICGANNKCVLLSDVGGGNNGGGGSNGGGQSCFGISTPSEVCPNGGSWACKIDGWRCSSGSGGGGSAGGGSTCNGTIRPSSTCPGSSSNDWACTSSGWKCPASTGGGSNGGGGACIHNSDCTGNPGQGMIWNCVTNNGRGECKAVKPGGGGGNGGSGSAPKPTVAITANSSCFNDCFTRTNGNGSGCTYVCGNSSALACWNGCKTDGKSCLTKCTGGTSNTDDNSDQTDDAGWTKFENDNKAIALTGFVMNKNSGEYKARGGTWAQSHDTSSSQFSKDKITFTTDMAFDKFRIGYLAGPRRTNMDVFIDGEKVGNIDTYNSSYIYSYSANKPWVSSVISCKTHTITLVPKQPSSQTPSRVIQFDYLDIHKCGATNPSPTPTAGGNSEVCQGNTNAPAQCFACNSDAQINILDFSCFSSKYGQNVGK